MELKFHLIITLIIQQLYFLLLINMKPIYKHLFINEELMDNFADKRFKANLDFSYQSATNYYRSNRFPLKYSKSIIKLNKRSEKIDEIINDLRKIGRNSSFAGLFLQYLLEACMIKKYKLDYDMFLYLYENPCIKSFINNIDEDRYNEIISNIRKNIFEKDELIIHSIFRYILSIIRHSDQICVNMSILDNEDIEILIKYFIDD